MMQYRHSHNAAYVRSPLNVVRRFQMCTPAVDGQCLCDWAVSLAPLARYTTNSVGSHCSLPFVPATHWSRRVVPVRVL